MSCNTWMSIISIFCSVSLLSGCAATGTGSRKVVDDLPTIAAEREFRAAWVATVANIDWPSKPGLSTGEQQREILAILDKARSINLNAIILQVRPQCDALYKSDLEPWSFFLTGEQGKAPDPFYDPLIFWIEEAHKRGLELHVWFNPYRAHHPGGGEVTDASVVKTHPEIVRELKGGYWWLDPALKATQDYSVSVVLDVVKRYDVDGVHFDDYFYPYPEYNEGKDFPDDDSWRAYRDSGGKLSRADWRRDSVNRFVKRMYDAIKKEKRQVKFGISPFGIWRPGNPASIRGFDQYDVLYADAKLWLNEGWVDYYTPQIYWPSTRLAQSFPVLLGWWTRENHKNRNLWPGLYTSRVADDRGVTENINQIMITRGFMPDSPGTVHFSMKAFLENYGGIADSLANGPYRLPALVPKTPWLDNKAPRPPLVRIAGAGENLAVTWEPETGESAFRYVIYYRRGNTWAYTIAEGNDRRIDIGDLIAGQTVAVSEEPVTAVAIAAVDRMGNESRPAIVKLK